MIVFFQLLSSKIIPAAPQIKDHHFLPRSLVQGCWFGWLFWEETECVMKAAGPSSAESDSQCTRNVLLPFLISYLLQAPDIKDSSQCRQKCHKTACMQSLDTPAHIWSHSYPHQFLSPLKVCPTPKIPLICFIWKATAPMDFLSDFAKKSDTAALPHRNHAHLYCSFLKCTKCFLK